MDHDTQTPRVTEARPPCDPRCLQCALEWNARAKQSARQTRAVSRTAGWGKEEDD